MQDNEIQGLLEISMQADSYLRSLSINHYLSMPLYLCSDCQSGADLLKMLTSQGLVISPNWLYLVPFQSSFEEIIQNRIAHDNYPQDTHWLDYILDKYLNDIQTLENDFEVESYSVSIHDLLRCYTIGIPHSDNLDETPLSVLFAALRSMIAKRLIKENMIAIRNGVTPKHKIENYF